MNVRRSTTQRRQRATARRAGARPAQPSLRAASSAEHRPAAAAINLAQLDERQQQHAPAASPPHCAPPPPPTRSSATNSLARTRGARPDDPQARTHTRLNARLHFTTGSTKRFQYSYNNTHTFNGPFSGTTQVGRCQKGKTNLDFTEARDSEWQWHQLGHMQVCTLLKTDNHASTPSLSFFTGRMPFLPPNQQSQSTEGTRVE